MRDGLNLHPDPVYRELRSSLLFPVYGYGVWVDVRVAFIVRTAAWHKEILSGHVMANLSVLLWQKRQAQRNVRYTPEPALDLCSSNRQWSNSRFQPGRNYHTRQHWQD